MSATLDVESTLTDRYQTTVPETDRRALRLGQFLAFLARDIAGHPEHLQVADAELTQRLQSLAGFRAPAVPRTD